MYLFIYVVDNKVEFRSPSIRSKENVKYRDITRCSLLHDNSKAL